MQRALRHDMGGDANGALSLKANHRAGSGQLACPAAGSNDGIAGEITRVGRITGSQRPEHSLEPNHCLLIGMAEKAGWQCRCPCRGRLPSQERNLREPGGDDSGPPNRAGTQGCNGGSRREGHDRDQSATEQSPLAQAEPPAPLGRRINTYFRRPSSRSPLRPVFLPGCRASDRRF
jgi:hypothetical protein